MRSQFGRATASGILEDSTLKKDAAQQGKMSGEIDGAEHRWSSSCERELGLAQEVRLTRVRSLTRFATIATSPAEKLRLHF